jgi:hypothetical protein
MNRWQRYSWTIPPMTRAQLYALVWEKPMVHVAKRFGISDVALRKICKKHDIPTPPLGYWAKLAYGKRTRQPPLGALKENIQDAIYLEEKPIEDVPGDVSAVRAAVTQRETSADAKIVVPSECPATLHPVVSRTRKAMHKAKGDAEAFIRSSGAGLIEATISRPTIDRTIILLDTLFKALKERGIEVTECDDGVAIKIDNEPFLIRVHETRDRKPHEPTAKELKEQADRDAWRAKYPSIYVNSQTKVYRTWDWLPSGRLSFGIYAADWRDDYQECRAGLWYDRAGSRVEDYLNAAVIALVSTAAHIRHKRAIAAEKARVEAEAAERRRQERERKERLTNRRKYLVEKADSYAKFRTLTTFANMFGTQVVPDGAEPFDWLSRDLNELVDELRQQFTRAEINAEIAKLGLFADEDLSGIFQRVV